jgi:hypothetical protein
MPSNGKADINDGTRVEYVAYGNAFTPSRQPETPGLDWPFAVGVVLFCSIAALVAWRLG